MFRSIASMFSRIGRDLRARRNIESYLVTLVAGIIAVVGLIDDVVPDSVKTSVILGALGLLVFNMTRPAEGKASIEDYLHSRPELGSLPDRLKGARKLWIYAPSAANVLAGPNLDAARQSVLSQRGGELRVIIQDPNKPQAVALLSEQLDKSVDFQHQHLPEEIANTLKKFATIGEWNTPGRFEGRLLPYSPGCSMVIIDPDKASGVAIIELYGWHLQSTSERMSIEIQQAASPRWFGYWVEQFEFMWGDATPAAPPSRTESYG
ncbi:MAG: hypothetical protein IT298_05845 [Chloroflexi bacterium]|nr:hypothetical protein [Chloroflexota bacterium]MBV6436550.1 hypothetical protein [Anaerolineae bacterium]MDL1916076.1 hypothetical protein [Anaerolineae bacterium CFX4]OQY84547.1 MAG: hypothetical protein B6D42_05110 [Anaerolineae bacterium UTCFX5]MCC6565269.1 hypothetical protein [Chloroflexota bacterium]